MSPESIEQFILPKVNMDGLSDTARAVILTAMYDLDVWEEDKWQELIDIFKKHNFESPLTTLLSNYPWTPYVFRDYFKGLYIPVSVHEEKRFAHTWICAKHGSGKTTLLENLIFHDLEKVKDKRATVLVMDSQGRNELLGRIERSFPCTLIDTSTPMNIFARPRPARTPREAEIMYTSQIDLITYVFSATLGDGGNFTPKQRTLWTYMVQLIMEAQGTVADMLKLLSKGGKEHYTQAIDRLSPPAKLFFANQFDDPKQYTDTKKELHWRLDAILQRPSFARMFTQRRALDFYSLLQKPQCILVDTDKALLGQGGTEIFGRFIIAMLLSASQQRGNIASKDRLSTYVYMDEAHDYISNDNNIAHIIDQARKMRMAFTFAHQRESQIKEPNVLDALRHCAIKLTSPRDFQFEYDVAPISKIIVESKPKERPPLPKPTVPANTVAPFIYEGEVLSPEPPRGLPGSSWGEDDIDQTPR